MKAENNYFLKVSNIQKLKEVKYVTLVAYKTLIAEHFSGY